MEPIIVPSGLWNDGDTAVIASWLYEAGEAVTEASTIVELMVDKTSYEIAAPASGTLQIATPEETEIRPGDIIGHIAR